jgi:ketosteroid isomerase-like protein
MNGRRRSAADGPEAAQLPSELEGWEELAAERVARLRAHDAWNRGDVEAWIERFSRDSAWHWLVGARLQGREGARVRGHEGLRKFRREIEEVWEELLTLPERAWRRGRLTLVAGRWRGRGRQSGVEVEMPMFEISERDHEGKSCWGGQFESLAEALEAAERREAATQASVDVVRRMLRAFSERDFSGALKYVDAEVIGRYEDPFSGPVSYRGWDEVRGWWERIAHNWEHLEAQIEEVLEARPDLVVVAVRFKARGRDTGAEVEGQHQFEVWHLRDGKLASFELFADKAQALEVAVH